MTSKTFPRLHRLCTALPATNVDEHFNSLSTGQRWLALLVASLVVLTIPPLLVNEPGVRVIVSVGIGVGTLHGVSTLIAWYAQR